MTVGSVNCPICRSATTPVGTRRGERFGGTFHLRHCPACTFYFVANPATNYAEIYDEKYYAGEGSDPMVDYAFEYSHPDDSIRRHDWEGIEQVVTELRPSGGRWLDYGCGNGALVRNVIRNGRWRIAGHDTGAWAAKARADGLPVLDAPELAREPHAYDVITAIEVIEHVVDPVGFLTHLRSLARPGALLFLTTLNAQVAPRDFPSWSYVRPEIHVSFHTPKSLGLALEKSGFKPACPGFVRGWEKIIRFKVLKNVGVRHNSGWHSLLPWSILSRLVDFRYRVSRLPVGIAV